MPPNTKSFREAKAKHDQFLTKMGVHPTQLKQRNKQREAVALRQRMARDNLEYRDVVAANRAAARPK